MPQTDEVVTFLKVMGPFFELVHEGEPEHVPASSRPQVTKVNGHVNGGVNGGVKMKETKVDERGERVLQVTTGFSSQLCFNNHLSIKTLFPVSRERVVI